MRSAAAILLGLALLTPAAAAETYPDRPIRLVSPNPAGGANDTIVRIIAAKMSPILGASIVVDNRGGAGGKIGAEAVARAPRPTATRCWRPRCRPIRSRR